LAWCRSAASPAGSTLLSLATGWCRPEDWGPGGLGDILSLSISLRPPLTGDIEVECEVQAVLLGARTRQQIDVVVDGRVLATWEFDPQNNHGIRSISLPADLVERHLPALSIEFWPHSVASPYELAPAIPDTRPLGLGLHRLRVLPASS